MKAGAAILAALIVAACLGWWVVERNAPPSQTGTTDAASPLSAAQARQRVIEIVNQPVTHLPRTAAAGQFSPGWFHPDAATPDFNTADIRATQQFPYDGYTYVSSDLNPTEMFIGRELEFNSQTKYFYIDRGLPKKRLSETEMLEINNLYPAIGREEHADFIRRAMMLFVAFLAVSSVVVAVVFR